MNYYADFATAEECKDYLITGKPFKSKSVERYLMVEPISETGILSKAKLRYRHPSPYSIVSGDWTYLKEEDLRTISPIIDFREKQKPFYIAMGQQFHKVTDIRVSEENVLVLTLEHTAPNNLN